MLVNSVMTLDAWNAMDEDAAAAAVLACCGSRGWARGLAVKRPLSGETLVAASDEVWWSLTEADWQEAFDSHPRIGQSQAKAATAASLAWSGGEQRQVDSAADATKAELAAANVEYERRFGRIFIVCATGKSAEEMLALLRARMRNDAAVELREAAEQQRQITHLRLKKHFGSAKMVGVGWDGV